MDAYQERQRAARTNLLIEDDNVTDDDLLPPAHDQLREAVKEMLQEERLVAVVAGEAQRSGVMAPGTGLSAALDNDKRRTAEEATHP